MKKYLLVLSVLIFCIGCATKAIFVPYAGYNNEPTVYGEGSSREEAFKNALSAVPAEYIVHKNSFRQTQCAPPTEVVYWDDKKAAYLCRSSQYRATVTLRPKSEKRRGEIEEILKNRRTKMYRGVGPTLKQAKQALFSKLPKNAVVDNWGVDCSRKYRKQPYNFPNVCDTSIEGNNFEIIATVRIPNEEWILPER